MIIYVKNGGNKEEARILSEKMGVPLVMDSTFSENEDSVQELSDSMLENEDSIQRLSDSILENENSVQKSPDDAMENVISSERLSKNQIDDLFASNELILKYAADGLTLMSGNLSMQGDFTHMLSRIKQGSLQREFLYKASKLKNLSEHPVAIDATAGMGEDSLILAAAGYDVYMYELNPVIAALLKDTVHRSVDIPELAQVVSRMHVMEGNSIDGMMHCDMLPDLILLDPMFPARKKSGLIKKKFQLLQQLEQPCSDEINLMNAAMKANPRRILVKRPQKGPCLADKKPDYSIPGKAIRYDVYTIRIDGNAS